MVPPKWTVVFKPGQALEERVEKECQAAVDGQVDRHKSQAVKANNE
jgi:hypothetical protein